MVWSPDYEVMFKPKTIAVVGASRTQPTQGWLGLLGCLQDFGFPGHIYPINPNTTEINGLKAYPNLVSVPEPIDLVTVSVPAPAVPQVLEDCIASHNRNVHIFTAGFKETGTTEGIKLEEHIKEIAQRGNLHVIGPNCMGLYVPAARLVTWKPASPISGPVAFISQSGGHAGDYTNYACQFGIHFSKVISYGNALTLDCTDFLEYLADDTETSIISMYLEGVKDGGKLTRLVREINHTKPIIMLKGGLTESGARAVASHTGSLAGSEALWNSFFKQTGAVRVESLEEMAEVVLSFLQLNPPQGHHVGIIGTGGGVAVSCADTCAREGLQIPPLLEETRKELQNFVPIAGSSIRNPLDTEAVFRDMNLLERTLDLVSAEPQIDMLIIDLHLDWLHDISPSHLDVLTHFLATSSRNYTHGKPMVVSWRSWRNDPDLETMKSKIQTTLIEAGLPIYHGLSRAAHVLAKLAQYQELKNRA
ncbi:MAG: CoA-binding protein [Thermodesulfobacteriota bacterium]|nr:CoA-binding protein [Thermodesulfobacteriota bacterium]